MAIRDIEAFMRERGLAYDGNLDVGSGSPFDVQVIQPLVRRLGTDPFTVDLTTFIADRMAQAFPDVANQDDDAITDLLNKPATLLWDPIVRENIRVRQNLSFADPTQMTLDEADALGANFFSTRKTGKYARGPGRILFQNPQNASISPANFFTSKDGLHFFPTETQSIRLEEMLLNVTTDGLYYFDVNLIAEGPGSSYNIEPNSLISVANVAAATRVTNLRRFTLGENEEGAQSFISRTRQELGERSLVSLRGIAAKLVNNFPEVNRLNVVGFNDPEMQRDIVTGGGLGEVRAHGISGVVVPDGSGASLSRRLQQAGAGFTALFGKTGPTSGWTITVFEAFGALTEIRELQVTQVVNDTQLEVDEQLLVIGTTGIRWTLRKSELTLSHIPGGILFPNTTEGTVVVPDGTIHVGGMYDTHVRGTGLVEDSFTIDSVTDDEPIYSGAGCTRVTYFSTTGFSPYGARAFDFSGANEEDTAIVAAFDEGIYYGWSLQVVDGPNAGTYRLLSRFSTPGLVLALVVDPPPAYADAVPRRWRFFDELNVDLLNPKETRVSGTDLITLQNSDVVRVPAGTDFLTLGVGQDDVLEILAGSSKGTYTVVANPTSPTEVQVDTVLTATGANISYLIYRANQGGSLVPPFVRVTKVELLDSSGQPVGTTVPYSRPVDVQTRAFQNPARGVKHDFRDARLGLVSVPTTSGLFSYSAGQTLFVHVEGQSPALRTLTLAATLPTLAGAIADLNTQFSAVFGLPEVVVQVGSDRLGIRPVGEGGYVAVVGGTACPALFGGFELYTTGDIRSSDTDITDGWLSLDPPIDFEQGLDVIQPIDGNNVGFYASPFKASYLNISQFPTALDPSQALLIGDLTNTYLPRVTFSPEQRRRVQVGARSLGSARVYFLEPTSFEVDETTVCSLDTGARSLRFIPDPTLSHQRIPPLPADEVPQDGSVASGSVYLYSASQDFVLAGIKPDDTLVIENLIIGGTAVLADPVQFIAGKTLIFSVGGGEDRTVIFLRDDASLSAVNQEVSRAGVVTQINDAAGEDIVELTGTNTLRFTTPKALAVRSAGTANSVILGTVDGTSPVLDFATDDVTNESPMAGHYLIQVVQPGYVQLYPPSIPLSSGRYPSPLTGQSFRVLRTGVQRISTTEMSQNEAEAGLYYFDVELVSEGAGDQYNVESGLQLTIAGYRSDGYYLTTDDENLTFSTQEQPRMVLSRTVLEDGVDDSPVNATPLTGESLQVTYDRSQVVGDIQNFITAESERVVCSNPLSRHLIPMFVRFDLSYQGGSAEDVILEDATEYVNSLAPVDTLDASDLQKIASDRGAHYIKNPLDLIGVVHRTDRSVWLSRSQDQLTVGRLTAFIPELLNIKKGVS